VSVSGTLIMRRPSEKSQCPPNRFRKSRPPSKAVRPRTLSPILSTRRALYRACRRAEEALKKRVRGRTSKSNPSPQILYSSAAFFLACLRTSTVVHLRSSSPLPSFSTCATYCADHGSTDAVLKGNRCLEVMPSSFAGKVVGTM
jgi:hypothetical protein